MPSVSRAALGAVYLVMLMDTLNFGIVFPLLPSIAKQFGANATKVGLMATTYSFCQMLATPILGYVSDKFGRRPVLLISVLGSTLSAFGTGWAWDFWLLVVARCINGLSGGTVGVVNAYVADVTTKEEKPVYMSYISAANSVGIIVGPALGGLLSKWGFTVACYVSGFLSLANLIIAIPTLKESRWSQAREITAPLRENAANAGDNGGGGAQAGEAGGATATNGDAAASSQGRPRANSDPGNVWVPCAAYYLYFSSFLLIFGFAAMESIVSYFLMDTFFHGDDKKAAQFYGYLFTMVGVCIFIVAAGVYKPARKCIGELPLVIVGASLRTFGFFAQGFADDLWLFSASTVVIAIGNNFIFPTTSSMLTTMCHHSIYGRALGMQQSLQAFARVIGPIAFGWAYDHINHRFSFYVCGVMTVLSCVLILMAAAAKPRDEVLEVDEVEANVETLEEEQVMSGPLSRGEDDPKLFPLVRSNSIGEGSPHSTRDVEAGHSSTASSTQVTASS